MLLNWIMLANELHRINRRQRQDPFADPLDVPEWDGLRWMLPALCWTVGLRKPEGKRRRRLDLYVLKRSDDAGAAARAGVSAMRNKNRLRWAADRWCKR